MKTKHAKLVEFDTINFYNFFKLYLLLPYY